MNNRPEDLLQESNSEESIPKEVPVLDVSDDVIETSDLIKENFEHKVDLVLSRKTYKTGGTIVGTIRLEAPLDDDVKDYFVRAQLYVAGRCRIDERWHNSAALLELYRQTHPCHSVLPLIPRNDSEGNSEKEPACTVEECINRLGMGQRSMSKAGSTVCIWSTNVVDLLSCPKQKRHDVKKSPSLVMAGSDWHNYGTDIMSKLQNLSNENFMRDELLEKKGDDQSGISENSNSIDLSYGTDIEEEINASQLKNMGKSSHNDCNQNQITLEIDDIDDARNDTSSMAFIFRVDLPNDIPPSAVTATARYFYSAVLVVENKSGMYGVIQTPFTLVMTYPSSAMEGAGRVQIGTCEAVSFSDELPCYVSPTTKMIQTSKISVITQKESMNSMRISNVQGIPCCVLTVISDQKNEFESKIFLNPGGVLVLHFDFLTDNSVFQYHGEVLPCAQVCACLEGEEFACYENKSKKRTRFHILDSDYALVDHGCTDSLSIQLRMPIEHEMYTFHTDLVQVLVRCKIDLTVLSNNEENYTVLSMELPCQISPYIPKESFLDENDENDVYTRVDWNNLEQKLDKGNLVTQDVINDLTMLSLHMLHET